MESLDFNWLKDEIYKFQPSDAWLAGSVYEGIGNKSSDLDVYALVEKLPLASEVTRLTESMAVKIIFNNDRRLDIEFWSKEAINNLAKKFAQIPIEDPSANYVDALSEDDVQFITRLHLSFPLIGDISDLRNIFDRCRFKTFLTENKRHYIDDAFDDTVGFFLSDDFESASLRARDAVEYCIDLLLLNNDIINVKHKYRWRLLKAAAKNSSELMRYVEPFWVLVSGIPALNAQKVTYVKNALTFIENVMFEIYNQN